MRWTRSAYALVVLLAAAAPVLGAGTAMPRTIEGVGFQTPESVLYDARADVYLVSNINGNPTGVDGNGFISRVTPSGRVTVKWIDGAAPGVTLNAASTDVAPSAATVAMAPMVTAVRTQLLTVKSTSSSASVSAAVRAASC